MSAKIRIDQIMAGFADGDAISHEARILRNVFRNWGHASDIFADPSNVSPPLRGECRPLSEYSATSSDLVLHQFGIASKAADIFSASPARKILIYQNITPAEFFKSFDDNLACRLAEARSGLEQLAKNSNVVWATSRYNALELETMGIQGVRVLPLHFDPSTVAIEPKQQTMANFSGPLTNILFVGRIAPNKRLEQLIEVFAWYQKTINRYSRLILVGSNQSYQRYYTMLRMLVGELDLPNVCFEGFLNAAELAACYRQAHVYVCLSEHEGYCLPLVEAMFMKVPVIARRIGGMPEALGNAGVLYDGLNARELAELINLVVTDSNLRKEILNSQQQRMQEILNRPVDEELRKMMQGLI